MATICPIAAVAVLPLAIAHGDVFGLSGTRLDVHAHPHAHQRRHRPGAARVRAEDDPDRHDRDRPGGAARARRRVVVPAARRGHQRPPDASASRSSWAACWPSSSLQPASTRSRSRDEVRRAAPSRRSAVRAASVPGASSPRRPRCAPARRARRPRRARRRRARASSRIAERSRSGTRRRRPSPRAGTRRARPARRPRPRGATRPPPRAPPAPRRPAERAQHAPEMHPRERRHAHVAGRLGLLDRELQRGGARLVVAGLALRAAEARHLVGLGLQEAEPPRRLAARPMWTTASSKRCSMPRELAEHRLAANVQPRVVDLCEPVLDLVARVDGALAVAGGDRGARREEPVRGLVPRPVELVVERVAAVGQLQRLAELAVVGDDVGEVVAARACRSTSPIASASRRRGDVLAGELEVTGRRLDPRRRAAARSRGRGRGAASPAASSAARMPLRAAAVAEDDPRPAEPVDDVERRAADRAPRSRPARRRCWRARPGRTARCSAWRRCARPRRRRGRGGEPRGVRGERAVGQPGLRHRLERERADAVEQPVATGAVVVVDDHQRPAREPPDDVDRRRRGHVERLEHGLDRRAAARRRRTWPAPTGPRWSSGNSSS